MHRTEDGAIVGSINVSELSDEERAELGLVEPETAETEDLSKLRKPDLVDRATAAGIDTDGLLKEDIIKALEGQTTQDGNP